jgi:hypothetical protein
VTGWLRLHHDAMHDSKLRAVASVRERTYAEVLGVWAGLLIQASAARPRGWINADALAALATDLGFEASDLAATVASMASKRLLIDTGSGWHVRKWRDRQGVKVDLTAAERKRRQRQRQRGLVTPVTDVTPVTSQFQVTPVTDVTPCHGVTFQTPYIVSTTTPASALRTTTEVSLSRSTEVEAERRASAPKRGRIFGWLIGESSNA